MSSSIKHFSVRGMSIGEMLTVLGKEFDEIFEDKEGAIPDRPARCWFPRRGRRRVSRQPTRQKAAWQKKTLADMRRFLGGETLN
jgi:hypothetical protein